jgi:hypothetical protein
VAPKGASFFVSPGSVHSPFAMKSEKAGFLGIYRILIAFLSRPHAVKPRTSRDFLEILNRDV